MRAAAALAILLGFATTPSLAADPIDWNNIVFEWVTVTVTDSTCSPSSTLAPFLKSKFTSTPTTSSVSTNSVTQIPYSASARIIGQPVIQEIVTSIPQPTIQTTWESTATYESSYSSVPVATATLRPAIVSNANLANPENLHPKIEHNLYYADDSNSGANDATMPIANVKLNFTMDAVNLESSHIQSVTCSRNPSAAGTTVMKIIFSDKDAYHTAMTTWPKNDDFLLIGYFPGCGAYSEGQRSFSKVHQITSNNGVLTVTAVVEDLPITDAITEGEIKFGSFNAGIASRTEGNATVPYYGVGVPDECLGDKTNDFDVELDNKLGITKDLPSFVSRFKAKRAMRRRREAARFSRIRSSDLENHIEKRWSIGGFFDDIGKAISDAAKKVVDTVKDAAEAAWDGISSAMKTIGEEIIDAGKTIIGTEADFDYIDTTASWDTFLSRKTKYPKSEKIGSKWNTPWGVPGFLLGADTETESRIFCVDCGVKGDMKLNGHLTFSLKNGLKAATFTMNGTMNSNIQFGFWAEAEFEASAKTQLFDIPLGPIVVPGIFDIGPQIVVSAEAMASITTTGMVTAGFQMDWNPYLKIDMIEWTTESQGWTPTLHPMIQIDGEIVAAVGLKLPIQIGFGINLFKGWLLEQVVISETPGLRLSARYAGQARADDKEKWADWDGALDTYDDFTCPNKVALFFEFTNSIDFEVTDIIKKNLGKATVPFWKKCLGDGKPSSTSTTTTTTEEASTSTTSPETPAEDATSTTSPLPITPIVQKRQEQAFTTLTTLTTFTTTQDSPSGTTTYITSSAVTSVVPVITASSSPSLSQTITSSTTAVLSSTSTGIESSTSSEARSFTTSQEDSFTTTSSQTSSTSDSSASGSDTLDPTSSSTSYGSSSSGDFTTTTITASSETETSATTISETSPTPVSSSNIVSTSAFPTPHILNNGTITSVATEGTTASPVASTEAFSTIAPLQNTTSIYSRNNSTTTSILSTTSTLTSASATATSALNFPKVIIKDAADGLFLNTNKDGTLFLCNGHCGSPAEFYTQSSVVVADTHERVIHIYSQEMEQYGVSRLRLHSVDKLPNTSIVVGLYEFQPTKVVAVSSEKPDVFLLPVACRAEGQPTKMFVVKEFESGIETLKSLGASIAGGKVLECSVKNFDLVTI
ncbi:hypothetical protein TWF281_003160 [Arthrobotrys megalospora]